MWNKKGEIELKLLTVVRFYKTDYRTHPQWKQSYDTDTNYQRQSAERGMHNTVEKERAFDISFGIITFSIQATFGVKYFIQHSFWLLSK